VYCGQTVGWIKMKLGMQVGLSPGHSSPSPKRGQSPQIFSLYLLWPNGCMDQDGTWYGRRPQPSGVVLDGDPAPPPAKGHNPPIFDPCLLWPNGHPSQLLLSTCSQKRTKTNRQFKLRNCNNTTSNNHCSLQIPL